MEHHLSGVEESGAGVADEVVPARVGLTSTQIASTGNKVLGKAELCPFPELPRVRGVKLVWGYSQALD